MQSLMSDFPDDRTLREILRDAHIPSLLGALAYTTHDLTLLREEFRPNYIETAAGFQPQGGLSASAQDEARVMAFEVMKELRKGAHDTKPPLERTQVRQIMEYMLGPFSDDHFSLLLNELGISVYNDVSLWHMSQLYAETDFTVAIIGAGLAGVGAAYRLKQAGIPFVILERNHEVGGVWSENNYPGCHLDTSNFNYSYSFNQNPYWKEEYASRAAVLEYLQGSAEKFGLREHIRFNTEVVAGEYNEREGSWNLMLRKPDGSKEQLRVQALISAVGQLNRPNYPVIDNMSSFAGHAWHTARWNHEVDLAGKRVGVIGTGASGFQAIQKIAEVAGELTVFQRSPPWIRSTPGYNSLLKEGSRWLFANVPNYHRWFRVYRMWVGMCRRAYTEVDPAWKHPISMSHKNEELRQLMMAQLEKSLADRPDLLKKMTPDYPPFAKRCASDDGNWFATLKKPNVKLVTERIAKAYEGGIETTDGELHELDIIVFGTGFKAADFLSTLPLTGRGGVKLQDQWHGDDARAYYGITVPNFPNLFCLYGPNTNINGNASLVLLSEAGATYIVECLRLLLESGKRGMEVRQDVLDRFNERIDTASGSVVYGAASVKSWYKNSSGRLTQNWPLPTVEYWRETRQVNKDDYLFF
ncbi:MAG: NAD(P)/FAD-dependent oxidoreductase [Betaproteobacteria bacterium]|nr:NAD(P)/FAD-dependent oxidoreductase [Betaproteobacteria bacterium]